MQVLPRNFYDRDADVVARELLGLLLVRRVGRQRRIGKIVETEAYLGSHDLAAHSSRGLTPRTKVMHGPPGFAYVYLIYGMHHCLNLVTGPGANASAVLIRAIETVANIELPTNGPGRLCRALEIDRALNGHDLTGGELFVARVHEAQTEPPITIGPRIGVDYAGEWASKPLRFFITGNPFVSRR